MSNTGCKKRCVKIWMCLAVLGCLTTLVVAAVVLSSYSFEPVLGPLSCQLRRIETQNCCYDQDCMYGKRYKYHFASNSSHCMSVYDIYNHPSNTSVHFTHSTDCYPSLASLQSAHHHWHANESLTFYVNQQCTEWSSDAEHQARVQRNGMWIAIILSFVGCSCVSMLCGFLTMYHMETLSCVCTVCCCCLFTAVDAEREDYDKNASHDSEEEEEEEYEDEDEEADSRDTVDEDGEQTASNLQGLAHHIKMSRQQQYKYDGGSVSSSRKKPMKPNKSLHGSNEVTIVNGVTVRSSSNTSPSRQQQQQQQREHSRKKSKSKSGLKLKRRTSHNQTDDDNGANGRSRERSVSKELQKMTSADIAEMNGIISPAHVSRAQIAIPEDQETHSSGVVAAAAMGPGVPRQPTLISNLSGLSNSSNPMISRKRPRVQSNASQPSKLSPLSRHDDEVKNWGAVRQFADHKNDIKIQISAAPFSQHSHQSSNTPPLELEKHPSMQRKPDESTEAYNSRIVSRLIGKMDEGNHSRYTSHHSQEQYEHEREPTLDEVASTAAMSDSVYFDNEWYEESHASYDPTKSPLGPVSRRGTRTVPGAHSAQTSDDHTHNNNMLTPKPRKKLLKTTNIRTLSTPDDEEEHVHGKIGHTKDMTMSTNPKSDADDLDDDDDFYE